MQLAERFEWKVSSIVLSIASAAKRLRLHVQHPDHRKNIALAFHIFPQRRLVREKILGGIVAQNDNICAVLLF